MLLKIHPVYGVPKFGCNLEYEATFVKGKNVKNPTIQEYRFLFKEEHTSKKYLLWLTVGKMPYGARFEWVEDIYYKEISPTHIKNKNYNYYWYTQDIQPIEEALTEFKKHVLLIPKAQGFWHPISLVTDYQYSFEFNGKFY